MSKKAKLIINNQEFDFPLVLGSENELSIDLKQLRALTGGVTTIDPGFKNTASCEVRNEKTKHNISGIECCIDVISN
jgi:citrate synthase